MKEYKIFVEGIKDKPIESIEESTDETNDYVLEDEIDEQRISDKTLYDLTSISECLTVSMHEYGIERNKKDSFDNRAGLIITVLLAIVLAIHDKISFRITFAKLNDPLTFILFLEIITTIFIYLFLTVSLYYAIRIIIVKPINNFNISTLNTDFISQTKMEGVPKLHERYLNLTLRHRNKNNKFAEQLRKSQIFMIVCIVLIIIYLNIL